MMVMDILPERSEAFGTQQRHDEVDDKSASNGQREQSFDHAALTAD
jgi:hypothetical protein